MTKEEIFDKVRATIAYRTGLNYRSIKMSSNLIDDLGFDDLDHALLFIEVGQLFNIELSDIEIESINLISQLVECIHCNFKDEDYNSNK